MTTNNASETTTVINNFYNANEAEIREQIAQKIQAVHLNCLYSANCTHEEDAAIALGEK